MSLVRYNADNPARHVPTAELRAILRAELKTVDDIRELAKELGIGVAELRRLVMPECPDAQQTREFLDLIAAAREVGSLRALRERLRDWDSDDEPGRERIAAIGRAIEAKLSELRRVAPQRSPWRPELPQWTSPPVRAAGGSSPPGTVADERCDSASASGW